MRKLASVLILIILGASAQASGEQPLEALQREIERGIRILEDPRYQDASRSEEQVQKLWTVALEMFDFREFSRQVLTSHWKDFSIQQQNEFVELIGEFLGKINLWKLRSKYNGEKIFYIDQKLIGKSRAVVEAKVLWKNLMVPITLRMKKNHGKWKVYDLSAWGVSAVENYRAQFHQILQEKSPEEVIEIFKNKIREIEGDVS